jgi:hypothetical protein
LSCCYLACKQYTSGSGIEQVATDVGIATADAIAWYTCSQVAAYSLHNAGSVGYDDIAWLT